MGLLTPQQQQFLLQQQHQNQNLMGINDIAQPFPVYAAADVYQGHQEEYGDEEQGEEEVDGDQDCIQGQQQQLKVDDSDNPAEGDGYG